MSADLENGFADSPEGVAETIVGAIAAGLAGCSIEDSTRDSAEPIYEIGLARERVVAAAEAADGSAGLVLTARAENFLHRPAGPAGHDRTPAGLRGGRRRRPLRARAHAARGHPPSRQRRSTAL